MTPSSTTIDEDAGTITFTITRSGDRPAETIYVSTVQGSANGYASNSGDYTGITNQAVTFTSGQSSRTVTVSINNDTIAEGDETFGIIVQRNSSDPVGTFLDRSTFTIRANDQPQVTTYSMTPSSTTIDEDAGTITFTITRSGDRPAETIYVSTVQGSANGYASNSGDYTGITNQAVTFTSGASSRTVTVSINNDTIAEGDETFGIIVQRNSSDPVGTFLDRSTFTIRANDQPQQTTYSMTPSSTTIDEDAGTITFTITRSGDRPAETIYVSTVQGSANGYASNSGDYTGITNQAVTFSSGESSRTVTVSINNDTIAEGDETFGVIVQRNSTDPLSTFLDSSTFTIRANDQPQQTTYSMTPSSTTIDEDAGTITFTITRSGDRPAETIYVSTVQGAANGYASNSGDYTGLLNQALTFSNGQASLSVTVSITNDTVAEGDETFGVIVQRNSTDPLSTFLDSSTFTIRANDQQTAADVVREGTDTDHSLSVGGSVTGTIDQTGMDGANTAIDKDWYKVSLVAGHTYTFDATAGVSGSDSLDAVAVRLYSSNTNTVTPVADGASPRLVFTATETRDYWVAVSAGGSGTWQDKTGEYRISVTDGGLPATGPDDYADSLTDNSAPIGALTIGQERTGRINVADADDGVYGDKDVFRVDLVAGQYYEFNLDSRSIEGSTLRSGLFTIRDQNFNTLETSNTGSDITEGFLAQRTGAYYVRVGAAGSASETGGYALSVNTAVRPILPDDYADHGGDSGSPGSLTPGGATRSGTIEVAGDKDYFTVQLVAGKTYYFGVQSENSSSTGQIGNVAISLSDSAAFPNPFRGFDDGYRQAGFSFTAERSGDFYVRVSGDGGNAGGYLTSVGLGRVISPIVQPTSASSLADAALNAIDYALRLMRSDPAKALASDDIFNAVAAIMVKMGRLDIAEFSGKIGVVGALVGYTAKIQSDIRADPGNEYRAAFVSTMDSMAAATVAHYSGMASAAACSVVGSVVPVAGTISGGIACMIAGSVAGLAAYEGIAIYDNRSASGWIRTVAGGLYDFVFRAPTEDGAQFSTADLPDDLVRFDEEYYLGNYSDVRDAIASGEFSSAIEHYVVVGINIGYSPNNHDFLTPEEMSLSILNFRASIGSAAVMTVAIAELAGDGIGPSERFVVDTLTNAEGAVNGAAVDARLSSIAHRKALDLALNTPEDAGALAQGTDSGWARSWSNGSEFHQAFAADLATVMGEGFSDEDWELFVVASSSGSASDVLARLSAQAAWSGRSFDTFGIAEVGGLWVVIAADRSDTYEVQAPGDDGLSQTTQYGGLEGETLYAGLRTGRLYGLGGDDSLHGGRGADLLDGGAGDDIVNGLDGDDVIDGGDGNDALAAGLGNDTVHGGAGNDVISGDGGSDVLHGDDGDDAFLFAVGEPGGSTQAFGGAGTDTVILRGGGASIDLTTNGGSAGGVAISVNSIENIQFDGSVDAGGGNRLAYGSAGNNAIVALGILAGVTFEGRGGDDLLIGGTGADTLRGGDGNDNISGAVGNDTIEGGAGADHLLGGLGADWIHGGTGNDVISGDGGSDILLGEDGDDAFLFAVGEPGGATQAYGGARTDTIILRGGGASIDLTTNGGSAGAVAISVNSIENVQFDGSVDAGGGNRLAYGSAVANAIVALGILAGVTFEGRGGDDLLVGGDGADLLSGGDDNDIIKGNGGDDAINGGSGTDLVELRGLSSQYTITAVSGGYRVTDTVTGRDGSDLLSGIETLRFSDGSTVSLASSAPAAPEVLPALDGDKTAAGPEVLPAAPDDKAAHDRPLVLPGVDDGFSTLVRDWRTATDFGSRDGDTALTVSVVGESPSHDRSLFVTGTDGASPEVLPAVNDGFIFTGKIDDAPPVMPPLTGDLDGDLTSRPEAELNRELLLFLARENLDHNFSGNGLTLPDDWSGIAIPSRDDLLG